MDTLIQIAILTGFLLLGMAFAKIKLVPKPAWIEVFIQVVLWMLLFSMGYKLGMNRDLFAKAGEMTLIALFISLLSVAGTIGVIVILYLIRQGVHNSYSESRNESVQPLSIEHFKGPLVLICIVLAGVAGGLFVSLPILELLSYNTTVLLYVLLFFIGIQLNRSGHSISSALLRFETILIPLGTIIGTMLAGIIAGLLFNIGIGKGLALSCGFGWYSLSGVLISAMGDELLGMTAFIANMFRESFALILIPVLAHTRFPYTAIGVGGATAMDVTLPLIEQRLGVDAVPVSFASGAVLSMLVPVLVPFFFKL